MLQHRALACQALRLLIGETLKYQQKSTRYRGCASAMTSGFEAASEPLVVPIRGEGILVREWPYISDGPHAACPRAHHHEVVERLRRQHRLAIRLGLAVEELFANGGNDFDVHAGLRQTRECPDQIDRRTRPLHNHIAVSGLT